MCKLIVLPGESMTLSKQFLLAIGMVPDRAGRKLYSSHRIPRKLSHKRANSHKTEMKGMNYEVN